VKRIVYAAALAGLAAGLALTLIQQLQIAPLLRAAETFETGGHGSPPALLATMAANIVLATGFALILGSALAVRASGGWRAGFLWGLAGYAVFFVAPSLGLPPELPGTESAALHQRQWWWLATVALSAGGLWLAAFARKPVLRILGIVLIAAPHVVGAPQPAQHGSTAPAALTEEFVRAAYVANAIFWLLLGSLLGYFFKPRA